MEYVKSFDLFGTDVSQIPCTNGKGKPTDNTAGAVGCLYMDTDTGAVYKCTSAVDGVQTWMLIAVGVETEEGGVVFNDCGNNEAGKFAAAFGSETKAIGKASFAGGSKIDRSGAPSNPADSDWRYSEAVGEASKALGMGAVAYARASNSLGYRTQTGFPQNMEAIINRPEAVVYDGEIPIDFYNPASTLRAGFDEEDFLCLSADAGQESYVEYNVSQSGTFRFLVDVEKGDYVDISIYDPETGDDFAKFVCTPPHRTIEFYIPPKIKKFSIRAYNDESAYRCYLYKPEEEPFYYPGDNVGQGSAAFGSDTTALENNSFATGYKAIAMGSGSFASGKATIAKGDYSHTEGISTIEDFTDIDSGDPIENWEEIPHLGAYGEGSHAEGYNTLAVGAHSHAEGRTTKATGTRAHAEGLSTTASGANTHAEGNETIASGSSSHAEGGNTEAKGKWSHAEGRYTIATADASHVQGKFNKEDTASTYAHIVGGGSSNTKRSNIHTLDWKGNAWLQGTMTTNGADYAEFFEWSDGNPNNEDRVGYLVSLDGDKIKLASQGDDVLGIISGTAAVLGDNSGDVWKKKYLTDDFGRIIYDMVEEFDIDVDPDTNEEVKISVGFYPHPRINPDFDSSAIYVPREERQEWDKVGMLGKLYVRDDGSCVVGGYGCVGENGVLTYSQERSNIRIMKRISENIVLVLMR